MWVRWAVGFGGHFPGAAGGGCWLGGTGLGRPRWGWGRVALAAFVALASAGATFSFLCGGLGLGLSLVGVGGLDGLLQNGEDTVARCGQLPS